jgi:hypothetical protein
LVRQRFGNGVQDYEWGVQFSQSVLMYPEPLRTPNVDAASMKVVAPITGIVVTIGWFPLLL